MIVAAMKRGTYSFVSRRMRRVLAMSETLGLGRMQGSHDLAFSGIVRGHGQRPRSKEIVQVSQVACGCHGRLHGISPFVHIAIDAQTVDFGRALHELPRSGCAGTGICVGLNPLSTSDK